MFQVLELPEVFALPPTSLSVIAWLAAVKVFLNVFKSTKFRPVRKTYMMRLYIYSVLYTVLWYSPFIEKSTQNIQQRIANYVSHGFLLNDLNSQTN